MAEVIVPTVPPLATVPNVELIHTGTWPISTGEWTVTVEDLAAAVAALECPAVRRPILKLGHTLPRGEPNPGEPAVGWVANLAVAESGRTLVGDYAGMPGWLGEVLASAYPDRSVEGDRNFRCQLGHTHPLVVHAVALLGVARPGVGTLQSLQDVADLYGVAAAAAQVEHSGTPITLTVHASAQEVAVPSPRPAQQISASVTTEDVRRAFYSGPGDSWDQWIESIELDPLQLIVMNDKKGKRYRVPVTVGDGDGEDAVSFGDPVEVVIRYEDAGSVAAGARQVIAWASRAESRPGSPPEQPAEPPAQQGSAAASVVAGSDDTKGPAVDFSTDQLADLRARLGLAEDAPLGPEQVLAALNPKDDDQDDQDAGAPATVAAGTKPVAGTMVIDASAWAERETRIKRLEAEAAKRAREERDQVIAAAVQAGKFPPARKEHWVRLWDADPEGTRTVLAGLTPNVVPVEAMGYSGGDDDDLDAEFAHIFPPAASKKG